MNKIVTFVGICLFTAGASAENEATYDPETGIIVIPKVQILGESTGATYSVEMQQNENSDFEITETQSYSFPLPSNKLCENSTTNSQQCRIQVYACLQNEIDRGPC